MKDKNTAESLLDVLENEMGVDLIRRIIESPDDADSLSALYDEYVVTISDSLAGFAGVKQNPDSINNLISLAFDSAWDTLFTRHKEIFGSYGISDIDQHSFEIGVEYPGCLIETNADTVAGNTAIWRFDRTGFFARSLKITLRARKWDWLNVGMAAAVAAVILFIVLYPVRKYRRT